MKNYKLAKYDLEGSYILTVDSRTIEVGSYSDLNGVLAILIKPDDTVLGAVYNYSESISGRDFMLAHVRLVSNGLTALIFSTPCLSVIEKKSLLDSVESFNNLLEAQ